VKLVLANCDRGRSKTFTFCAGEFEVSLASVFNDLAALPPHPLWTSRILQPFVVELGLPLDLQEK
jgi:hypothetical protein